MKVLRIVLVLLCSTWCPLEFYNHLADEVRACCLTLYRLSEVLVIVIPWVVRLYVEIIYELKRVDYLTYRWTNMV